MSDYSEDFMSAAMMSGESTVVAVPLEKQKESRKKAKFVASDSSSQWLSKLGTKPSAPSQRDFKKLVSHDWQ
jgi:hypothetical protein